VAVAGRWFRESRELVIGDAVAADKDGITLMRVAGLGRLEKRMGERTFVMASEQSMDRAERATGAGSFVVASGLTLFAAVFMFVGGTFQALEGLAAILNDDFFAAVDDYAYDIDVTAWGWMHLIVGIILALTGLFLLSGSLLARMVALFIVVVAAIINFIHIPYQPLWSIVLLVINGAIIWALLTYPEPETSRRM
jgi:hypothetical protein